MTKAKQIIVILLIFFCFSVLTRNLLNYRRSLEFYEIYKKEYELEKKRNNELKLAQVKTQDPYELEKAIRNQLNLVKPGEQQVVIPPPTPAPTILTPTPLPNYQKWWHTFFGN